MGPETSREWPIRFEYCVHDVNNSPVLVFKYLFLANLNFCGEYRIGSGIGSLRV